MLYLYRRINKNQSWYYGHSDDPVRRLYEHNVGQNKSTKSKGPWQLIFLREFGSKQEANRFELLLKKYRNKGYILKEYGQYFITRKSFGA
ncbi:MAG: GIY-YIG nuclease family protein [Cyclobacteriaceae bacterium]|nr:GIY-YIG nuclease family protein [Cyclobacteriaceae bacterium]